MRYQHPDLEKITTFLLGLSSCFTFRNISGLLSVNLPDFGMEVAQRNDDQIWFRGYGSDQYVYYAHKGPKQFLGASFQVESYQDLEK